MTKKTNPRYETVQDIGHPEDLVPKNIKIQSLNTLKAKLEDLQRATLDEIILNALTTMLLAIEDAYHIYMYRFQFQLFTNIINKEIKNIEEIIFYENKGR